MQIHIPVVKHEQQFHHLSERASAHDNLTVGLLDNTKKNADLLLEEIARLFANKLQNVVFRRYRKPNSSTPYSEIETIAKECNLVINAHGD